MQWLLKKYNYRVNNKQGNTNELFNIIDCILCLIYAVISIINAINGIDSMQLYSNNNSASSNAYTTTIMETILLLIINIVILLRLNIKLYLKSRNDKEKALGELVNSKYKKVTSIVIKTWDKRIQLIKYVYLADFIIIVMNIYYKSSIETSLSLIVILPIIVTLLNNLIDIAENKFCAEAEVEYTFNKEGIDEIMKGADE